ncbi:hypothetical protein GIB67_006938 [Kingdonia uniflora]|uniref:CCHC-type domain-containing protein n=1 Tax=Kingdonia uniflora TaxID=39325 RepID=A0A7J7NGJ5_9MAGN|nr:hypothetical protein GIB67_006938 [Kingdonia uniflora]
MLQFPAFMKQKPSLIAGVIPSSVLLPSQWPQPHNDELLLALEEADLEEKSKDLPFEMTKISSWLGFEVESLTARTILGYGNLRRDLLKDNSLAVEHLAKKGFCEDQEKSGKMGMQKEENIGFRAGGKRAKCHYCGEKGHFKRECNKRKQDLAGGKGNGKPHISTSSEEDDYVQDQHLNVAYESNVSFENEWIFILGVTYHICPKREWFLQYRESHNGGNIVLLNGSVSKAVGRGTIEICMPDGVVRRLGDVLHVPGLCVNVISVPRLCSKGCEVINKLGVMEVELARHPMGYSNPKESHVKGDKYNEIRKTNSNVVVIGRTSVDNDKEEFDNDADEEEADNAEETDGDEFEQETG